MNTPPTEFIRVPHEKLHAFVARAGEAVGLPPERASVLADALVANDLRGVFSHGTQQIAGYAPLMRDGHLNAKPNVHIVRETPTSVIVDGDGGLGYFPALRSAERVIELAKQSGIAVGLSRNHGHFGAAGIYSRKALLHGLLAFVTSGHQLGLSPGNPIYHAGGGSPMSFSFPTGDQDPFVLDFGAMHDLYMGNQHREEIARLAPAIVFRSIGLGAICQTWGALLAGVPLDPSRATRTWSGANQGSLVIMFRIDLFMPVEQFERETSAYVRAVRQMAPVEGFTESYLPGGIEAVREREYRELGVPVGRNHQSRLQALADELGIERPW